MRGNLKLLKNNIGKIFLLILYFFLSNTTLLSQCLNSINVYHNNFDSAAGPGWSIASSATLPASSDSLGPFGTETLTFRSDSLPALPCHDSVKVSFRLILKGSWDGNGDHCCGPDIFILKANGVTIYQTTFSNTIKNSQSYPAQYYPPPGTVRNNPYTGSANNNNGNWSTYFFSFTFPHTTGNIIIDISQPNSQGITDEAWFVDDFYLDVCRSSNIPSMQVIPSSPIICSGDSIILSASGAVTYSWSPSYGLSSTSGSLIKASPANTTTYTVTGNTSHCSLVTSAIVTVKSRPSLLINKTICQGASYLGHSSTGIYHDTLLSAEGCPGIRTLNLVVNPKTFSTITQSICEGQSFSGHNATGIYVDTLVTSAGCDSLRTLNLTVLEKPAPDLGTVKEICTGDSLELSPGNFASYLWQDNSTSNHFMVKHSGVYSVIVTNSCGSNRGEISISEKLCDISFPNAFTPNKDGKNDIFKILDAYSLKDYSLVIYNYWGQKLFETKDYRRGWDGTFNGKPQNSGVYVYYCRYKKSNLAVETKGTVILIR